MKSLSLELGPVGLGKAKLGKVVHFRTQPNWNKNNKKRIVCKSVNQTTNVSSKIENQVTARQTFKATAVARTVDSKEQHNFENKNLSHVNDDPPTTPFLEEKEQSKPPPRGISKRIKRWLPSKWTNSNIPFASQLNRSSDDDDESMLFGDGMATATAPIANNTVSPPKTSTTRRGWHIMSRYRGASSREAAGSPPMDKRTMDKRTVDKRTVDKRTVHIDHPTLEVIKQRILTKSQPGARHDNFKLGLAIEGGGMRGCVSGGALQALTDLGLKHVFDAVYGSSAGAINATFFLSNQREGVHIYHNNIANEEFIDLKRLWSRKQGSPAALNLDLLLGNVMQEIHPLEFDAVLSSEIPLNVVASSLDTLSPVLLQSFEDKDDLITSLRASATVPEVAGGPVHHRGHRLVDAAVFEPVPFRSAIADGCTHVLVLCTRPSPTRKGYLDQALTDAMEIVVKKAVMSPEYMIPAWEADLESLLKDGVSQDDMLVRSFDEDAHELPWFAGTHVYPVYPLAGFASFSPLCIDVPTLKQGVAEGRASVISLISALMQTDPSLGNVLDVSHFKESANILPLPRRSASSSPRQLKSTVRSSSL